MLEFNLDELRKRGYDEETFSDEDLFGAGETICEIISLFTNRDFELKTVTLKLDGDGTNELILPIPIVSITSVTDDSGLVASTDYVIYNREIPDDRQKPKIIKISGTFPKGNQNVEVQGMFGWVEGGLKPKPLLEAAYRILYLVFQPLLEGTDLDIEIPMNPSEIKKEIRDKWSYEKFNREQISGLFDNFVTAILMKYSKGDDILAGSWV